MRIRPKTEEAPVTSKVSFFLDDLLKPVFSFIEEYGYLIIALPLAVIILPFAYIEWGIRSLIKKVKKC